MSRPSSPSGASPAEHTAVVGDVATMWSKLRWDADVFRDIQIAYPDEGEPLAYAAINVCVAAKSLRDWAKTAAIRADPSVRNSFDEHIRSAIPHQAMCDAIANTAKHAAHRDGEWGGCVLLNWEEGDEDAPEGYVLRYLDADGGAGSIRTIAVNQFDQLLDDWFAFLLALNLVTPDQRTPAWLSRKLGRIFPPINDALAADRGEACDEHIR